MMRKFIGRCLVMSSILISYGGMAATVSPDTSSMSYRHGSVDRDSWEEWYDSQQGQKKEGASYWAGNRSKNPLPCAEAFNVDDEGLFGCMEAQRRLALSDYLRKSDPQYWNGWNKKAPFVPGIPGEAAPSYSPPSGQALLEQSYCSDADVTSQLTQLIEGIHSQGSAIRVLRLYNYRTGQPCVANLIANDGLYSVTYGKRMIDGDSYIFVHLERTGSVTGS
jgi:hypothetical protein